MSNLKFKIAVALACVLLVTLVTSTRAVEYNPGVSKGQWVKYGNIVGIGTGYEDLNDTDWMKIEVTEVSGKNVTLHMSGKYKNGTDAEESGQICNVETGTINGTSSTGGLLFIIAANLTENDAIVGGSPLKINKTETRTYASVSRTVNIFNVTMAVTGYNITYVMVWDKASGMLLELEMSMTTDTATSKMSFKAADTNIFVTGVMGWLTENIIYIVIAIVVVVLVIAAVLLMRRRKPPTTTTTTTTSKT